MGDPALQDVRFQSLRSNGRPPVFLGRLHPVRQHACKKYCPPEADGLRGVVRSSRLGLVAQPLLVAVFFHALAALVLRDLRLSFLL